MQRVYNFGAGPSALPESVLRLAAEEMLDYNGCGMSVMELSHRSKEFADILTQAEQLLRELMGIPDNYHVLFLQGGASTQFAMVPLNLMNNHQRAGYIISGSWAKKEAAEAKKFGEVIVLGSSEASNFTYIPTHPDPLPPDLDYVHITTNNTIYGTRFSSIPETGTTPLVADMSSNILSEEYDISKFGLIYAGAQKNIAPAGLTIVIVRNDLVGHARPETPTMLDYATHVEKGSLYNTPPCFTIYMAKLVFEWAITQGGIPGLEEQNKQKAAKLYDYIDNSTLFSGTAAPEHRSRMNVPFVLPDEEQTTAFLAEADKRGLKGLKGHRSVGGMRASLYNAVSMAAVDALLDCMHDFEKRQ